MEFYLGLVLLSYLTTQELALLILGLPVQLMWERSRAVSVI